MATAGGRSSNEREAVRAEELGGTPRPETSVPVTIPVHDELVLEVDSHLKMEAGMLLQTCMESAASLLVPLPVKLKAGRTWGSMEPLQLDPQSCYGKKVASVW